MDPHLYQVAVDCPVGDSLFTYSSKMELKKGDLVEIPFGKRTVSGAIWQRIEQTDFDKIKSIKGMLPTDFKLSDRQLQLYDWMAKYYHYPVGKLIFDIFPKILKRPRKVEVLEGVGGNDSFELTSDQQSVFDELITRMTPTFSQSLVHGVTGSGKSIIFYQLIAEIMKQGKSVLYLLPEINLTPQFLKFFSEHLNCRIFTYHSNLNNSEKYYLWTQMNQIEGPKLILSVRSGVFLPIDQLGLIVVDEEHDSSFKQEDRCCYNARDVAIKRASLEQIPVVLGSATPSCETYYRFKHQNPESYFALKKRVGEAMLPEIEFLNLTERSKDEIEKFWPFTAKEIDLVKAAINKEEQVLVFLNRLGYASYLQCRACGHQFECPNCSVTLKYFKRQNELSCGHCNLKMPLPLSCPECQCLSLVQKGFGTEKVQEKIQELIPEVRAERFDRDEIKNFEQLENKLDRFHKGEIDVLIGTQMLSKGHNFRRVNTVLIMGIDSLLNFPDFRSSEKVYQTLSQVSGRSGRYQDKSQVSIQTLNSTGHHFQTVANHNFDEFYQEEFKIREICECPPYTRLAVLYISSPKLEQLTQFSLQAKQHLESMANKHFQTVRVLGPRANMLEKRVNQWTWNILLKSSNVNHLHNLITTFKSSLKTPPRMSLKFDIDPINLY